MLLIPMHGDERVTVSWQPLRNAGFGLPLPSCGKLALFGGKSRSSGAFRKRMKQTAHVLCRCINKSSKFGWIRLPRNNDATSMRKARRSITMHMTKHMRFICYNDATTMCYICIKITTVKFQYVETKRAGTCAEEGVLEACGRGLSRETLINSLDMRGGNP